MDFESYNEMSNAERGEPWYVPEEFLTEDGDLDVDAMLTTLEEFGYITYDSNNAIVLTKRLKNDLPDVHELLSTILRNHEQAMLDQLVDNGVLQMSINSEGQAVYIYTEDGAKIVNRYLDS